jgi:hypothetical protein
MKLCADGSHMEYEWRADLESFYLFMVNLRTAQSADVFFLL